MNFRNYKINNYLRRYAKYTFFKGIAFKENSPMSTSVKQCGVKYAQLIIMIYSSTVYLPYMII